MSDSSSNKNDKTENLSEAEVQRRLQEAREKFDLNFQEFKRKKVVEVPCKLNFRSLFSSND